MSSLEHLVENGLTLLDDPRVNTTHWREVMQSDTNFNGCPQLSIDDLWEICQYVKYVWLPVEKEKWQDEQSRGTLYMA